MTISVRTCILNFLFTSKNKPITRIINSKTQCFRPWFLMNRDYFYSISLFFMIKDLIELVKYLFRFLKENVPLFHFHVRTFDGRLWGRGGPGCQGRWVVVVSMAKMLVLRKLQVIAMLEPAVYTLSLLDEVNVNLGAENVDSRIIKCLPSTKLQFSVLWT